MNKKRKTIAGPIDIDKKEFLSEVRPWSGGGAFIPAHALIIGKKVKVIILPDPSTKA